MFFHEKRFWSITLLMIPGLQKMIILANDIVVLLSQSMEKSMLSEDIQNLTKSTILLLTSGLMLLLSQTHDMRVTVSLILKQLQQEGRYTSLAASI